MSKIDLEQLRTEIRTMKPYHRLYVLLRDELKDLRRWKNLERGDARKGGLAREEQHERS